MELREEWDKPIQEKEEWEAKYEDFTRRTIPPSEADLKWHRQRSRRNQTGDIETSEQNVGVNQLN
jgi:hypothetical protein